jgi:hypothetical protein
MLQSGSASLTVLAGDHDRTGVAPMALRPTPTVLRERTEALSAHDISLRAMRDPARSNAFRGYGISIGLPNVYRHERRTDPRRATIPTSIDRIERGISHPESTGANTSRVAAETPFMLTSFAA